MTDRNEIEDSSTENTRLERLEELSRFVFQLEAEAQAIVEDAAAAQARATAVQSVDEISSASDEISSASDEISSASDEISSASDEISSESDEISAESEQLDQANFPTRTHYSFKGKGMKESIQQRHAPIHREGQEANKVSWFVLTVVLALFCGKFI